MPFFDHMLQQLGKHAGWDLDVTCKGDLEVDGHHTVEDVGIAIGQALSEALGDKAGVRRFASIVVPLDEAAVEVALDLSGRNVRGARRADAGRDDREFDTGLVEDFVRAFATDAPTSRSTSACATGAPPTTSVEATFKAYGEGARRCGEPHRTRRRPLDQRNPVTTIAVLDYGSATSIRSRARWRASAAPRGDHGRPGRSGGTPTPW